MSCTAPAGYYRTEESDLRGSTVIFNPPIVTVMQRGGMRPFPLSIMYNLFNLANLPITE